MHQRAVPAKADSGADAAARASASPRPGAGLLSGFELYLGIGALGFATFLVVIDLTIINVILPSVAAGYGAAPHEVTMAITVFSAAQAVVMPLTGWLTARFGTVRTLVLSLAGFGVTSLLCGVAPSLPLFLLFRVLQGLSCGPIVPLVQTLLQRSVPRPQLPAAYGFWSLMLSAGPLAGPLLGGVMADSIGWPWGFFINVPIAAVCVVIVWRIFGARETARTPASIDVLGLVLLVTWVGCLQFVLDKGRELDWFADPLILTLTIVAGIAFVVFLIWVLTDSRPLIDFSVLRYRSFLVGTPISSISFSAHVVATLLLTLWLQLSMNYTATWAGYAVASMGVSALLAGPVAALLSKRLDARLVVALSMALTCAGLWWRAAFYGDVDFRLVVIAQLITGFSSTAAMGPLFAIVMSDIPEAKLPAAAGLLTFVRMLVLGVLTAVMTTAWQNGQNRAHSDMAESLHTTSPGMDALPIDGAPDSGALFFWNGLLDQQSIAVSTQSALHWLVLYVAIGPLLIWLCPRPQGPRGGGVPATGGAGREQAPSDELAADAPVVD